MQHNHSKSHCDVMISTYCVAVWLRASAASLGLDSGSNLSLMCLDQWLPDACSLDGKRSTRDQTKHASSFQFLFGSYPLIISAKGRHIAYPKVK